MRDQGRSKTGEGYRSEVRNKPAARKKVTTKELVMVKEKGIIPTRLASKRVKNR